MHNRDLSQTNESLNQIEAADTLDELLKIEEVKSIFPTLESLKTIYNCKQKNFFLIRQAVIDVLKIKNTEYAKQLLTTHIIEAIDIATIQAFYAHYLANAYVAKNISPSNFRIQVNDKVNEKLTNLKQLCDESFVKDMLDKDILQPHQVFEMFEHDHGKKNHWGFYKQSIRYDKDKTRSLLLQCHNIIYSEQSFKLQADRLLTPKQICQLFVSYRNEKDTRETLEEIHRVNDKYRNQLELLFKENVLQHSDLYTLFCSDGTNSFERQIKCLIETCNSLACLSLIRDKKLQTTELFPLLLEHGPSLLDYIILTKSNPNYSPIKNNC